MDLTEFITARLAEDEALIRRNMDGRGLADGFPDYRTYTDADTDAADDYISHFGPARLLREVAAKRQVVEECKLLGMVGIAYPDEAGAESAGHILRLLAAIYASHPDYEQEWAPTTEARSSH